MVTDDARAFRETLEAATCKRVSALEGVGATERVSAMEKERGDGAEGKAERPGGSRARAADKGRTSDGQQAPEPERDRFRGTRDAGMEMRCPWLDPSIVGTVVGFQSVLPDPLLPPAVLQDPLRPVRVEQLPLPDPSWSHHVESLRQPFPIGGRYRRRCAIPTIPSAKASAPPGPRAFGHPDRSSIRGSSTAVRPEDGRKG